MDVVISYYKNGKKKEEGSILNDKKEGKWFGWWENGNQEYEGEYKDGKQEGKWTGWHENKEKWYEVEYKNGKENGKYIEWWENGKKQYEGEFKDGEREGKWFGWWENGTTKYEGEYKNGKFEGKWTGLYKDGSKMYEGEYKNGEKEGKWFEWHEDGSLKSELEYKDGKILLKKRKIKKKIVCETDKWTIFNNNTYYNKLTKQQVENLPNDIFQLTKHWIRLDNGQYCNTKTKKIKIEFPENEKYIFSTTDDKIIVDKSCFREYIILQNIGKGGYGSVVLGCLDKDCEYVIKIQSIKNKFKKQMYEREVQLNKLFSNLEVAPKYYNDWTCGKIGLIVSQKWDGALKYKEVKSLNKIMIDKYQKLIEIMHEHTYVHCDLFPKNILVMRYKDEEIVDICITDFGITNTISHLLNNEKWLTDLYNYHAPVFKDFFKITTLEEVKKNPFLLDGGLIYYMRKHQVE